MEQLVTLLRELGGKAQELSPMVISSLVAMQEKAFEVYFMWFVICGIVAVIAWILLVVSIAEPCGILGEMDAAFLTLGVLFTSAAVILGVISSQSAIFHAAPEMYVIRQFLGK